MTHLCRQFAKVIKRTFGFRGPAALLADLFHNLDTDEIGRIGFDELYELIRGVRHSLDHRKALDATLQPPHGVSMDELVWSTQTLRVLMVDMLEVRGHSEP